MKPQSTANETNAAYKAYRKLYRQDCREQDDLTRIKAKVTNYENGMQWSTATELRTHYKELLLRNRQTRVKLSEARDRWITLAREERKGGQ